MCPELTTLPTVASAKSALGNETLRARREGVDPDTSPAVAERRRDLAAAKLAAYIDRIVADAPELTSEQKAIVIQALTS